ncbi:hypothetical protein [Methylocystis bryophila]|uniref:hypothetical protein n=1 Tax=Methylocystis bryophila TaxID=655015 RepID=UPI001319FA53|nr:hypothetical protein [Methylocystis bryophila]BDV37285.1 hypothetical protein DSM21852_05380 [Methylocystis bryophila]
MEKMNNLESMVAPRETRPSLRDKRRESEGLAAAIRQTQDAIKKAFTGKGGRKKIRARLKQTGCA